MTLKYKGYSSENSRLTSQKSESHYVLCIQKIAVIGMACLITLLSGCGNSYEQMEQQYQQGKYLEASQHAVKALQNPELKPQVEIFLQQKGGRILDRLILEGELLMKRTREEKSILYFQALIPVLEQLLLLNAPIPDLDKKIRNTEILLQKAILNYCDENYTLATDAYKNTELRDTIRYLDKIKKYKPSYRGTPAIYSEAMYDSVRNVILHPFIHPLKSNESLEVQNLATFEQQDRFNEVIEGVEVTKLLNDSVNDYLNKAKSEFLHFFRPSSLVQDRRHYEIKGWLKVIETQTELDRGEYKQIHDTLKFRLRQDDLYWEEIPYTFGVYQHRYKITIEARIVIQIHQDKEVVSDFVTEGSAFELKETLADKDAVPAGAIELLYPTRYLQVSDDRFDIDKTYVLKRAIDEVSLKVAQDILATIDKQKDPIFLRKEATKTRTISPETFNPDTP